MPIEKYSEHEVELGLATLALSGGNTGRAEKVLASKGISIPRQTLREWMEVTYPERYTATLSNMRDKVGEQVASESMEIAAMTTVVERDMVARLQRELHDVPADKLAAAVQKLAQAKEQNARTARLLRDQPTSVTEIRDPAEIIAELKSLGVIGS